MSTPVLTSFNAGELTPLLDGRADLQKYAAGCRTLENFFILPQGGVTRRPGTQYLGNAKDEDHPCRLMPFIYSQGVSAILEFGYRYMRVWRDGGLVTGDDGNPYEISTPYNQEDVFQVAFVQSADVMFLVHPFHHPQKLFRKGWAEWTMEDLELEHGVFKDENIDHEIFITPVFPEWLTATNYVKGDIVAIGTQWSSVTSYVKGNVVYKSGDPLRFWKCIKNHSNKDPVSERKYWRDHYQLCFRCLNDHTSTTSGSHDAPPGNTVDWEVADNYYAGTKKVTLYATDDIFEPEMVGGLWLLRHPRDDNTIDDKFTMGADAEFTDPIKVEGTWTFTTHGNWGGTIKIERSFDNGITWQSYREYSAYLDPGSGMGDRNVDDSGEEDLPDAMYRITQDGDDPDNSGTCRFNFTVRDYLIDGTILLTDYIDERTAKGTVVSSLGSLKKTNQWAEGAWSVKNGYPCAVTVFEERLVFAGSAEEPQTVWFSMSNDYENFTPGELDNNAMSFTISSDRVDAIKWIATKNELIIGTIGGEWKFGASKVTEPLTPTNLRCQRQSTYGSGNVPGTVINDVIMFFQEHEQTMREFSYSFEKDIFVAPSMTVMAEHINRQGVLQIAYQRHPYPIIWCCRKDGQLTTLTYNREEEVVGWSRQVTDGNFESVAVITGDGEDEVWVCVKRTIKGVDKRYIERFSPRNFKSDLGMAKFLDSHLTASPEETTLVNMQSNYGLEENAAGAYVKGTFKDYHLMTFPTPTPTGPMWDESLFITAYLSVYDNGGTKTLRVTVNSIIVGEAAINKVGYLNLVKPGDTSIYAPIWCNNTSVPIGASWTVRLVLAARVDKLLMHEFVRFSNFTVSTTLEGQTYIVEKSPAPGDYFYYIKYLSGVYKTHLEHPEFNVAYSFIRSSSNVFTFGADVIDKYIPRLVAAYKYETDTPAGLGQDFYPGVTRPFSPMPPASTSITRVSGKSGYGINLGTEGHFFRRIVSNKTDWTQVWYNHGDRMVVNVWCEKPTTTDQQRVIAFGYGTDIIMQIQVGKHPDGRLMSIFRVREGDGSPYSGFVRYDTVGSGFHMLTFVIDPHIPQVKYFLNATQKLQWDWWDGTVYEPSPQTSPYAYWRYWDGTSPTPTLKMDEMTIIKPLETFDDDAIPSLYNVGAGRFISSYIDYTFSITEIAPSTGGEILQLSDSLSGLTHLSGKVVEANVDGCCHQPIEVTDGGEVTLDNKYNNIVCVGLPYASTLETMRLEGEAADGGTQERKKRATEINIRFHETINGKIVSPEGEEDIISFRKTSDLMTRHIPLFSGDKKVKFSTGFNYNLTVKIRQQTPMPMTVLLLSPKMWTYQ